MKVQLKDKYIYWIAAINSLLLIVLLGPQDLADTHSYIASWDNFWSIGVMDKFRTPVYPFFLGFCKNIAGDNFRIIAIFIQHIVLILSIFPFMKTASFFIKSHKVVWWLSLLYAINPGLSTWANVIQTEFFAYVSTIFIFYNLIVCVKQKNCKNILWTTLWLTFIVFLRPAQIYLFPICIIGWLFMTKYNIKYSLYGLAGTIFVISLYMGYCHKFKDKYGLFVPSVVSVGNQLHMALEYDLLSPEFTDNTEYKEYLAVQPSKKLNYKSTILNKISLPTIQQSIKESYRAHSVEYIKKTGGRLYRSANYFLSPTQAPYNILTDPLCVSLGTMYLFLFGYMIFTIFWLIKYRTIRSFSLLLWLGIIANISTVILGAQDDWNRLILPSLPLFLIILGQTTNFVSFKLFTNKNNEILV